MEKQLLAINESYKSLSCCHTDGRQCNCYECLQHGFYTDEDKYDCEKKICYYVLNYGPAYVNEIYSYLSKSKILENNYTGKTINVLSLGCGFCPDLLALEKYIHDNSLSIKIIYQGIDSCKYWNGKRYHYNSDAKTIDDDLTTDFDIDHYDLIFIVKLYSTLHKANKGEIFIEKLLQAIEKRARENYFLIMVDVNTNQMGLNDFHGAIKDKIPNLRQFYMDLPGAFGSRAGWIAVKPLRGAVIVPKDLAITPKPEPTKVAIFEYRNV